MTTATNNIGNGKRLVISFSQVSCPGLSRASMPRLFLLLAFWFVTLTLFATPFARAENPAVRIKDITTIRGVRGNQLVGYGLVVGLRGTGDSMRASPFTEQSLRAMLERLGAKYARGASRSRNVASVMVTATLPPFAQPGDRIDVNVASLGDATSLSGGTLIMTPLKGADGKVYAVAQGPLTLTGFAAEGQAASVTRGVPTNARIPAGAIIERELRGDFHRRRKLVLSLKNPDFNTAEAIAAAINTWARANLGQRIAAAADMRTVRVIRPRGISVSRLLAAIGNLRVKPDTPARVVIDERSGTVVIGQNVRISTVAVTHGNITVRITEMPMVSQPKPFSRGRTVVVPQTIITPEEKTARVAMVKGAALQELVAGLNRIGLKPKGIIAILQAIKSAGALQADLVVQ